MPLAPGALDRNCSSGSGPPADAPRPTTRTCVAGGSLAAGIDATFIPEYAATGDGRRATGNGRWATGDGQRATGNGQRANGRWGVWVLAGAWAPLCGLQHITGL